MEAHTKTNKKFWKPPSFEDFNAAYPNKKIKLDAGEFLEENINSIPIEPEHPKTISELAVHSKKIEEVRNWIRQSLKQRAPILLVTGPAGSGKTITIKVTANEVGVLVKEWINPVDKTEFKTESFIQPDVYDRFGFSETRQVDKFEEFVFRSSRYNSLFDGKTNTMILIEDIPNIFMWKPKLFHKFLEKYKSLGNSPIVFILTDDQNLNLNNNLFPSNIKVKFNITNIKFNPVNHSCLVKNLKILSEYYSPDKVSLQLIENLSRNSSGDVRSATNDLLLFMRTNVQSLKQLPKKKNNKKNMKKGDGLLENWRPLSEKDSNVDFYHALGRILYPKLLGEKEKMGCANPNQVFLYDVRKIAECWGSSFLGVLHQNYLQTYGKLMDVVGGAECFSFCDVLEKHEGLKQYSSLIGVITLMLKNTGPKKTGFNPIKGSFQWNSAKPETCFDADEEFHGHQLSRGDVHLDLLPFLKILKKSDEFAMEQSRGFFPDKQADCDEEFDSDVVEIEEFDD